MRWRKKLVCARALRPGIHNRGGSTPDVTLPTWLILIDSANATEQERRLRANQPPIIARIEKDCIAIDLRTVLPEEEDALVEALRG